MKEQEQRIAIAEACGWHISYDPPHYQGLHPRLHQADDTPLSLPDYLNDLNAMHEAEKVLRGVMKPSDTDSIIGDRMHDYAENLNYAFDATAAQRAEAFLKTIGKWEESK